MAAAGTPAERNVPDVLDHFAGSLAHTAASEFIKQVSWIIPATQTVHILCISIVTASIAMLDLRLMQVIRHPVSIVGMAHRTLPWVWGALGLLALTGTVLIVGEPGRELSNPIFWTKMALIVVAVAVTASFQFTLRRDTAFWELSAGRRNWARVTAVLSLVLWFAIVVAGRWIAYAVTDPDS